MDCRGKGVSPKDKGSDPDWYLQSALKRETLQYGWGIPQIPKESQVDLEDEKKHLQGRQGARGSKVGAG